MLGSLVLCAALSRLPDSPIATFSIAAADPESGEVGVAVASKFFAVGAVVPFARAGVGAIATQAFANTSYGPRGLELLAAGKTPAEIVDVLTAGDAESARRQVGIVSAAGDSKSYTGKGTTAWAGGRHGRNYAVQGNILTGEDVVAAMEKAFLETRGDLADRLYAALLAGDARGGDSRGRQSAALVVKRKGGGYGGFDDNYIDIRIDDHQSPIVELKRLLDIAHVNGLWNLAWTDFTRKKFAAALPVMERTAELAERSRSAVLPEVLYDLAVLRAAAGKTAEALEALRRALAANPKLREGARADKDLDRLRDAPGFAELVGPR